jgi:predicted GIY-YIG superfamily endonuclease
VLIDAAFIKIVYSELFDQKSLAIAREQETKKVEKLK